MFIACEREWAEEVFGRCEMGDPRRTRRLVEFAAHQARQPELSVYATCKGNRAAARGAYRLIGNTAVEAKDMREGGFLSTLEAARSHELMIAAEDTTTISVQHAVAQELGDLGGPEESQSAGWFVHSALLVDAHTEQTVGLAEQRFWMRDKAKRGQRHRRKQRAYEDKESFKWQAVSEGLEERFGELVDRIISVCDREADVFEYLQYKLSKGHRFVVRASRDRRVVEAGLLWQTVQAAPEATRQTVRVSQRGFQRARKGRKAVPGRKARTAVVTVRSALVTLRPPKPLGAQTQPLRLWAVHALEERPPEGVEPLEWMLLTTEPAAEPAQALQVLAYYRLRWRIEDFHKAWKTGCRAEDRHIQSADGLERLISMLAFHAVRILQLRELDSAAPTTSCESVLDPVEWRCLWASVEKRRPPRRPPDARWAHQALARLGGWTDSKRDGRVGWQSLWRGWGRLQERVEGWRLAFSHAAGSDL